MYETFETRVYWKIWTQKIIKEQSKLTINATQKSYENCDSYTLKQNETLMDKPFYLGFAVSELSKLFLYETWHNKLQLSFGRKNLHILYVGCDSFILSIRTESIRNDLKNLEHLFDFNQLGKNHENHEPFSNKIRSRGQIQNRNS